ncbi:ArfGap-domain-containing protein [Rickenella mellea]|uniref:ArfGap-domain-containing protein n=1 Tax=Rickenella mellea TaxID=50990 RepID=A0A4R5XFD2_9AGAM|nr:ArfGap-domain-containing protein [Rickenella mellea]
MDQVAAKKELQELIKREELQNKICVDCSNPNPQWASISFAVFMCLQCAGMHRGFGVHISFVRSVSMDTWQEDQIRRMKLGGNAPFRSFMESYTPVEHGGYREDMTVHEKYHCWAATQYREKLNAELEGKSWVQSAPPSDFSPAAGGSNSPGRPSSAQGLRKSRASTRQATGSSLRQDSASPASFTNSPSLSGSGTLDAKTANESYFANLGSMNASRPADLPPSQGGRYQGFGSTPTPPESSQHPAFGLSSAAAPSLTDFQENPTAALSKGWSLLSAAVIGASRVVSETVIQPGLEKVNDPSLQATVKGYVSEAGRRAGAVGQSANQWSRQQLGVDVAESVGGMYDKVKTKVAGPGYEGYGALATEHEGETSALYHDGEEDFFGEFTNEKAGTSTENHSFPSAPVGTTPTGSKKADDWDEWKDF